MSDEGEYEAVAYTKYEVDCPYCEEIISTESDPQGEVLECVYCDGRIRVVETR